MTSAAPLVRREAKLIQEYSAVNPRRACRLLEAGSGPVGGTEERN